MGYISESKKKDLGQIFTPVKIVNQILDEVGYRDTDILNKKIIEPSFGEGAFLVEIANRLITVCERLNMTNGEIKNQLEGNIFGIELDCKHYETAVQELDRIAEKNNLGKIEWNLINGNALHYDNYGEFDFVVGNPPYVRIHRLDKESMEIANCSEYSKGVTDLYMLFFELGIKLLSSEGILGYITPNSFMKNTSQGEFRKYLIEQNLLDKLIDFKSMRVFENVGTYTAITILKKNRKEKTILYEEHNEEGFMYSSVIELEGLINKNGEGTKDFWNFGNIEDNEFLSGILNRESKLSDICTIQYGIVTNRDSIYISKVENINENTATVDFNGVEIERDILKPAVKGNKCGSSKVDSMILFPYKWNEEKRRYEPLSEEELSSKYPLAYKYLLQNKEELLKRDMEKGATTWYQFGRSQGISNINNKKLVLKSIVKKETTKIEVREIPKDIVVYAGFYITSTEELLLKKVKEILESEEFCKYSLLVGRDKQGGYKSLYAKDIKRFGINIE